MMRQLQGELRMWMVRVPGYRRQSLGPLQRENLTPTPTRTLRPVKGARDMERRRRCVCMCLPSLRSNNEARLPWLILCIQKKNLLRIHCHEFIIIGVWFSRLHLSNEETPRWQIGIKNVPSRSTTDKNLTIRAHKLKLQNTQRKNPPCQQK